MAAALILMTLVVAGEAAATPSPTPAAEPPTVAVEVLRRLPHDRTAFTQGLLLHEGQLLESSGLYGRSFLHRFNPDTGTVAQRVPLEPAIFAEGIALTPDDRLVLLTWKEQRALVFDRATLEQVNEWTYTGEGWGLTTWRGELVMSNGSSTLSFRSADTFEVTRTITVRAGSTPVTRLNELEATRDHLYANIWTEPRIARIDPATGRVLLWIDCRNLLTPEEAVGVDVLNGIAWREETNTFFITGKLWPRLFEVRFPEPPAP
jgi:glutamine cyclotransferase